jgi:NTP-dependent ternary system trypsin peptidase co-occuring protein
MSYAARVLCALMLSSTLACATSSSTPAPSSGGADREGAELTSVMASIREALVEAQTHDVPGFPPLKSITLKLQTTVSRSAGGGIRYLVFSIDSTSGVDTASTLELEMRPPASRAAETLLPAASLKETLAKAIHLAKIGVLEASKGDSPLAMRKIDIDLKFAVQVEGSAGGGVKLLPLGVEGTGRISKEKVQSVSLIFGS